MKKCLSKILILTLIITIFVLPFSVGIKNKKVSAAEQLLDIEVTTKDTSAIIAVKIPKITQTMEGYKIAVTVFETPNFNTDPSDSSIAIFTDNGEGEGKRIPPGIDSVDFKYEIPNLKANSSYVTKAFLYNDSSSALETILTWHPGTTVVYHAVKAVVGIFVKDSRERTLTASLAFTTSSDSTKNDGKTGTTTIEGDLTSLNLGCTNLSEFKLSSCVAQLSYVIWSVSALIARAAGGFLDFLVYYSTNDSSYKNTFITEGWGAVRDIANIFFIITLLFIAIKTILGLNVTDNKKLIGAVIIIGLIINFSLFTTKVVIDSSNILAKVFYNNINSVDKNGNPITENGGEKSVSVGIVKTFNPQNLVTQSQYEYSPWTYIFMTVLLTALILYMSYIFFSVGLLFVARVISLWISMIFSPLAFISYATPFEIPGFGHKEWWKGLLENALLAPFFIFFLYIIIKFAGFLNNIISYENTTNLTSTENLMQHVMATLIPFVILFALLKKAKHYTVQFAGEMGEGITGFGAKLGGFALGAATGGAAMLGRQTFGRVASNIAETETMKNWAAKSKFGAGLLKTTRGIGSGSFDARSIKVGGKSLADTGLKNIGKAKEGGFTKERKDYVEKQEKFASSLEMSEKERYSKGLIYTGDVDADRITEARIKAINKERTGRRAETVEGRGMFNNNVIAAVKIREAGRNKSKKIQDALAAIAGGGGTPHQATGGGGATPTGGGGTPHH